MGQDVIVAHGGEISKLSHFFKRGIETTTSFMLIIFLFIVTLIFSRLVINVSNSAGSSFQQALSSFRSNPVNETQKIRPVNEANQIKYSLNCSQPNTPQTCSRYPPTYNLKPSPSVTCPHYFHWIQEDLKPWKDTGITREMVEKAKKFASIRIVILNGKVYLKKYRGVFQTRDVFTIWGILQLLRLYPGQIPDLDLMYQMDDIPSMRKSEYMGVNNTKMPPLFHFCADKWTFDIIFPDWSFWGWPEIGKKPWNLLKKELEEANKKKEWKMREQYAYWKGNLHVGERLNLKDCNITKQHDWNARIYQVDWDQEIQKGFKGSKLSNQCNHRYNIYIEGNAWSVSEKYILACGSTSLFVEPQYYDFFSRSLVPTVHYWPIKKEDKCQSIKFAVDWGNKYVEKAQEIGAAGSRFVQQDLEMEHIYDYMYHLLRGYANLLRYNPTIPDGAEEMCMEKMACNAQNLEKQYMVDSMIKSPSSRNPCSMPLPYNATGLQDFVNMKENLTKQVEMLQESGKV